jgi:subtilisin family serine protease
MSRGLFQNAGWTTQDFLRHCILWCVARLGIFIWVAGVCSTSSALAVLASPPNFRTDQILIKPKPRISAAALDAFHSSRNATVRQTFKKFGGIQVVRLPEGASVTDFIAKYRNSGLVEFAEPDYLVHASATTPNDPRFLDGTLWGLNNYGQNDGMPGADIHAPDGWDILTSASNVVVAILDTGVRYTHEDLASNMWVSPVDGGYGYNAFADPPVDPNDDNGHGTLIAGLIGGVGNNGKGVTGVAWQVQMMACKCLDTDGNGSESTVIACIEYACTNGARIINASLDTSAYSDAVSNAIVALRDSGIIFVASAGNSWSDLDSTPRYPACYDIDNIVSVAYTDSDDLLGLTSNFGATQVDLAAPGDEIYSTYYNADDDYYPTDFPADDLSGTSFAAAYVSGALALLVERFPTDTYQQIIARLLKGVDKVPDLDGKCVTGGRLNLRKVLSSPIELMPLSPPGTIPFQLRVSSGPNRTCVIQSSADLMSWSAIQTNTTSADGTVDFTDSQSVNNQQLFYRAVSDP